MALHIKDGNPPADKAMIERFEGLLGLRLPVSYRRFLLQTNGGVPRESYFPIFGMPNNSGGSAHVFLGFSAPFKTEDIENTFAHYRNSLPQGLVPIACTAGDDLLFLDLRNGKSRVAFWDHRHFWGAGEWREQDLYHVADSFDEFLTLLRPSPY